jgi:Ni/Fe-hydrogenase subunit HybB-like protein
VSNILYPAEPLKISWGKWRFLLGVLFLIGLVSFIVGISGSQAQRVWQAYLINFVFWLGLAAGSILFVAVLNLTHARWGRPLKRLGEALGAFVPVCFILFWPIYGGRASLFPWIHDPVHGKEQWLNVPFFFVREGIAIFLLGAVATALIYFSVRADSVRLSGDHSNEAGACWKRQQVLSPVLGILYALVLSLVAFDLVMSLDPHWYSTLFGGYFFVGSFYTALAALALLTGLLRESSPLKATGRARHFHDLGKLLFGLCMMTGYLFYSQFLVIWYGNLPEETRYVIERTRHDPWVPLPWIILVSCFGLPFFVLLIKRFKTSPRWLMGLSAIILIGMWFERFLLIAPSIWRSEKMPLGLIELAITAGFLGAAGLTAMLFLKKVPFLPVSDPLFLEETARLVDELKKEEGRA